jgi:hypothetical protein
MTYKRPLLEGEVCEDSRVQYNPTLGKAASVDVIADVIEEVIADVTPVKPVKASTKTSATKEVPSDSE